MSSDSFHNYYEKLVLEHILTVEMDKTDDPVYIATLACVALNHLPPRYMPKSIDLTLFMSPKECQEIELKVSRAVKNAIILVNRRQSLQNT